jgi:hypothetical protein
MTIEHAMHERVATSTGMSGAGSEEGSSLLPRRHRLFDRLDLGQWCPHHVTRVCVTSATLVPHARPR